MTTSSLTVGPAEGQLLLKTTAEGKAARLGHALTLVVHDWQCVAQVTDGKPVSAEVVLQLASLEVLRGEGGAKPLSAGDKKKVLSSAAKTIGSPSEARFVTTAVAPGWELAGELSLHGVTRPQVVHVTVAQEGTELRITGTATVRQTDHAITPYSQMLGALQVGDEIRVLVEVVVPAP
jgi:polyisoprenoid-binding protein YceI